MKVRLGFLVILVTLGGTACGAIYSRSTATALERDLSLLSGVPGFTDPSPICAVIGTTRTGYCLYETSSAEVSSLVERLALHAITLDPRGSGSTVAPQAEIEEGCLAQPGFENPIPLSVYESERRGETIRLESGTAFEYLLLIYEPVGNVMCIQASYAYG
jgi:hypothetical protein